MGGENHLQLHPERGVRICERSSPADPECSAERGPSRTGPTKIDLSTHSVTLLLPWQQGLGATVEKKFILFLMPVWRLEATGKACFSSLPVVSAQENGNEIVETSSISESQEKQSLKELEQQKLKKQHPLL